METMEAARKGLAASLVMMTMAAGWWAAGRWVRASTAVALAAGLAAAGWAARQGEEEAVLVVVEGMLAGAGVAVATWATLLVVTLVEQQAGAFVAVLVVAAWVGMAFLVAEALQGKARSRPERAAEKRKARRSVRWAKED